MARDHFVHFNEKAPSHDDLQRILENYFGGCGLIEKGVPNWWTISLPGRATSPFDGIEGARPSPWTENDANGRRRWIEVVLSVSKSGRSANVDVMTRNQDDFTNAIAEQLAKALARFYAARFDVG